MAKIVGPGSLNADVTVYSSRLPVAGETVHGERLTIGPGGKGTNQMTAAHRAGAEVKIIGRRGTDFLGEVMNRHYVNEGISTEYIFASAEDETASAVVEIDLKDAQNRIIVVGGANMKITAADVYAAEKDFADCDVVLTQLETSMESIVATKEMAKKYGKTFILNPAPVVPLPADFLSGIDYVTPNETEAATLTGIEVNTVEDCEKAAAALHAMGVKNVIITLGKRGAFFSDGTQCKVVPCLNVKAVETTGAGDAFNGGFATAIAEGRSIEEALYFASCTAAIEVSRYGSAVAMPKREEILALLKEQCNIEW